MSEEVLKNVLKNLGFTDSESKTYLFLARHGSFKGTEIAKQLKKDKAQIYRVLKDLQLKGFVESTLEVPVHFTAVPLEKVVETAIQAKKDEAAEIENTKQELLDYWKKTNKSRIESSVEKFILVEGRKNVYSKVNRMITETQKQLSTIVAIPSLLRSEQFGLYHTAINHPKRAKISYRFLTDLSSQHIEAVKSLLKNTSFNELNFKIRTPNLTTNLFPRMVIRDDQEALFFITHRTFSSMKDQDEFCLWTNCLDLVQAFSVVFEQIWNNSINIKTRIKEIENDRLLPETVIIKNEDIARQKYVSALDSAEKEVITMTSEAGLLAISRNEQLLQNWAKKGVSARILAPITNATQKSAQYLMKTCEVRHIPTDCIETAIVDGVHLFESNQNPKHVTESKVTDFSSIFYTDDCQYIEKKKKMLDYIWRSAQIPSSTTLQSIADQSKDDSFFSEMQSNIKVFFSSSTGQPQ